METIKTKRFGNILANEDHFIYLRDGMIGMSSLKKYILVESPAYPLMFWLQSCDDEIIAFPVVEPSFYKANYNVRMTLADKSALSFQEGDRVKYFSVLTIPENAEDMTVNLKAPVAINLTRGTGTQVVQQDKELQVRQPAYKTYASILAQIDRGNEHSDWVEETWSPISIQERGQTAELSAAV